MSCKHKWTHSDIIGSSCNICKKLFNHKSKLKEKLKKDLHKFSVIEDNIQKENSVDVKLVKEENEKGFCDVTLACDEKTLFHCDECAAKFSSKNDLNKHKWTHSDIIASSCNICQKLFNQKSKLEEQLKKDMHKFSVEYFDLNVLKIIGAEERSFLSKHDQNFIFQVF